MRHHAGWSLMPLRHPRRPVRHSRERGRALAEGRRHAGRRLVRAWERGSSGNAPTTRHANARQAYVLMDRATYLTLKNAVRLQVLVEKDPDLLNDIAVIRVNPARLPKVNAEGARRFADWLVSPEAQRIIAAFGVDRYGEPLFFPNARP